MTIETKFNSGDTVWFIHKEKPVSRTIRGMQIFAGLICGREDSFSVQYDFREYDTTGFKYEDVLFPTKESLLQSL